MIPRIEIGPIFAIFGVGDKIKPWPVVPASAFFPNLDYVNLNWAPPGEPVTLAE